MTPSPRTKLFRIGVCWFVALCLAFASAAPPAQAGDDSFAPRGVVIEAGGLSGGASAITDAARSRQLETAKGPSKSACLTAPGVAALPLRCAALDPSRNSHAPRKTYRGPSPGRAPPR